MNENETLLRDTLFRVTETLDLAWKETAMPDALRESVEEAVSAGESALNATRPPRWDHARFAAAHTEEIENV